MCSLWARDFEFCHHPLFIKIMNFPPPAHLQLFPPVGGGIQLQNILTRKTAFFRRGRKGCRLHPTSQKRKTTRCSGKLFPARCRFRLLGRALLLCSRPCGRRLPFSARVWMRAWLHSVLSLTLVANSRPVTCTPTSQHFNPELVWLLEDLTPIKVASFLLS